MARYIPPGAKSRGGGGANNVEDSQRSLGDIAKEQEGSVFTVNLRSDNTYSKSIGCPCSVPVVYLSL